MNQILNGSRRGGELRDDILQAQTQYQPEKKPWGARFDWDR